MPTRIRRALLAALAVVLVLPSAAHANGGASIAVAPPLPLGQLVSGGGQDTDFWKLSLDGGDKLTIDGTFPGGSEEAAYYFQTDLFAPSVTDFTYFQSSPVAQQQELFGEDQAVLQAPSSGVYTLAFCEGPESSCSDAPQFSIDAASPMNPYTFTATVSHAVSLAISTPTLAARGSTITVRVNLGSPAGTPEGNCLIAGSRATATDGHCTQRVRLGSGHRQTITVSFLGNDGWQNASSHRTIRLTPAQPHRGRHRRRARRGPRRARASLGQLGHAAGRR
jgi:hypothetical protein